MNDEQLKQLLSDADAAAGMPPVPDGFARRVIQRARKRKTARRLGAILSLVVIGGISVWMTWGKSASRQVAVNSVAKNMAIVDRSNLDATKAKLAHLEFEAELHQRIATAMLRSSQRDADRTRRSDNGLILLELKATIAENREEAAHLIVAQGDRLLIQPNGRNAANAAYRRVIELFPRSAQASVARRHLSESGA